LRQIHDHIKEVESMVRARTRPDLESDRLFFLALLKLVEIVGEAATRISDPLKTAHPEIPWREMIGMRNRLIHGYDSVDRNILWDVATTDLPSLGIQIETILKTE
jgi:uncharacterized protein with HEPN domain